jgi:hypothetical protein
MALRSNLFDSSPGSPLSSADLTPGPKQKRRKLWSYDHASHIFLNDAGMSGIEKVTLKELFSVCSKGNKAVAFFSELCDETSTHNRGIAHSRNAETMQKTIEKLNSARYRKLIKGSILDKAKQELGSLLAHVQILNASDMPTEGTGSLSTIRVGGSCREETDVDAAAQKMHAWLSSDKSALRSLICALSAGGLFYVTQVHEKVARAYIDQKRVTKEEYIAECVARLCRDSSTVNDMNGM